jgi:cell division GTPase FtsZ
MGYDPGAYHIEVNVSQAIPKMITTINHGAMETVSPEGAAAVLAEVIVLSKLSLQLLHEAAEIPETVAHPKEVNVITGDTKGKEGDPVFADSISQAGAVFDSVESEAQKELAVVAAMRQVVDVSWLNVSISTCHGESSER